MRQFETRPSCVFGRLASRDKHGKYGRWRWVLVAVAVCAGCAPSADRPQVANRLLGRQIGALPLQRLTGDSTTVASLCADSPCAIFVVSKSDCLDCLDYPSELRIVASRFPHLRAYLVGTGPDTAFFREYFERRRMAHAGLLDPEGIIGRVVATDHTPIALLLAPDGTVLFVDTRSGPEAAGAPVSRIVLRLRETLDHLGEWGSQRGDNDRMIRVTKGGTND